MIAMPNGASTANADVLEEHGADVARDEERGSRLCIGDWTISSRRRSILSDQEMEGLSERISRFWAKKGKHVADDADGIAPGRNFTPLPEIVFGHSFLQLRHGPSGLLIRFNTAGALISWAQRHLDPTLEVIKVPAASKWAQSLGREATAAGLKAVKYDWVFGTDYEGEFGTAAEERGAEPADDPCDTRMDEADQPSGAEAEWQPAGPEVIDRATLQSRDLPILYYDDITLYEDELHDHGCVQLNVKIRVMPTCWFVLLRFWLRVDGMLMKIHDTRYFHRFGSEVLGREQSKQEVTWQQLKEMDLPIEASNYTDPNRAAQMLGAPREVRHSALTLSRPS